MKVRQLFFDLDRTLWDFEANSKRALQLLYEELELHAHIDHFLHFHHTYIRVNAEMWTDYGKGKIDKAQLRNGRFTKALAYHGIHDTTIADKMSEGYIALSPYQTQLFPQTKEMLQFFRKEGYRMHVITNGFKEVQHIKLSNSGLTDFFDLILCSEEIGVTKPHRAIFQEAQRRTDCKPEHAIMIGDDFKADIIGALNAGWTAIHFDPEHKIKKVRDTLRIRNLGELPNIISMLPLVGG